MKKILPFSDKPFIKTYPYIAFYLGILEGNGINLSHFLIKNFTHTFLFNGKLDFVTSGFFQKKHFHFKYNRFLIKTNIENIIKEIQKNHYVIVILNEKYITNPLVSVDFDFPHDWLIYGYDREEEFFYCAGYHGKNFYLRKYGTVKISFSEVQKALKKSHFINKYTFTSKDIHSTWIKSLPNTELSNSQVKKILYRKLNPPLLSIYYRPIINLDAKSLEKLIVLLKKKYCNWGKTKNKKLWIQSYRILYENIKILKLIGVLYISEPSIFEKLDNLNHKAELLLLIVGKYNLMPTKKSLMNIINLIEDIEVQEKTIIEAMIKFLEN